VIREIRVHGNAAVPDAEVLRIAGIAVGGAVEPNLEQVVTQRLKDSGRFETIDVRKRYRSLTDATDVAIVLLVHEKTGVITTPTGQIERPISRRITSRIMFLPILGYSDGYGFTYGARFSTVDLLGFDERLSVPLTWGGTRRVALELERTFDRGPLTRVLSSISLWQRENPGFAFEDDEDDSTTDRRVELKGRAERNFAQIFFTGVEATRARVDFGPFPTRTQWTIGADAAIDTRSNPTFPANAIYLGGGWNRLHYEALETNRYTVDARGYLRLIRQPVLAGRIQYFTADGALPAHERWLIGGSSTLRGFRAGSFNGTKALVTSAELRVPITSVISGGKLGFTAFMDAARVGDEVFGIQDARWQKSAGAGLFLIASVITLNLDIAREIREGGGTRIHLSSGFVF
jgi:outer membrane protein assembly factor BamA